MVINCLLLLSGQKPELLKSYLASLTAITFVLPMSHVAHYLRLSIPPTQVSLPKLFNALLLPGMCLCSESNNAEPRDSNVNGHTGFQNKSDGNHSFPPRMQCYQLKKHQKSRCSQKIIDIKSQDAVVITSNRKTITHSSVDTFIAADLAFPFAWVPSSHLRQAHSFSAQRVDARASRVTDVGGTSPRRKSFNLKRAFRGLRHEERISTRLSWGVHDDNSSGCSSSGCW